MVKRGRDRKAEELAKSRTLNPHPEAVLDAAFASSEFFDAADLVQVKYEMVRRVEVEGIAVNAAAHSFGFSRQSYYSAAAALADGGLPALVPAKPGPRAGPQAQRPGPRSSGGAAGGRPDPAQRGVGAGGGRPVRNPGASPLGRTSPRPPGVRPEFE